LLSCKGFCDDKKILVDKISYSWLFGDSVDKMVKVAKELSNRRKVRKKILDEPG
jgi:hypothetical protein